VENPCRTTEAEPFVTFVRVYFLFRSGLWSSDVNLAVRKALIGSVMTYANPSWDSEVFEFAAPPKQECKICMYMYFLTKLCRTTRMISVRNTGQGAKPNIESKGGYIWRRSGVWPFK